jgi:hypothetical protein
VSIGIDFVHSMLRVEWWRKAMWPMSETLWRDPALLYPVRHSSEQAQQDLLRIKLRDSLVRARVALINSVRSAKSLAAR